MESIEAPIKSLQEYVLESMASTTGMHVKAEACGWTVDRGRQFPSLNVGVQGVALQTVRPMCAGLSRSQGVLGFPFHSFGSSKTLSVCGSGGPSLRFGTSAIGAHLVPAVLVDSDGRLTLRAVAKAANVMPEAETARDTGSAQETQVKTCPECQHPKLLVDFEKTVTSMDGLTDVCRACLAVVRAKSMQKELHHLGISVTEAWERAKACTKCRLTKELRDFPRATKRKDQTDTYCRACISALNAAKPQYVPTDQPLRCSRCEEIKAPSHFSTNPRILSGRNGTCRSCHNDLRRRNTQTRRNTQIYLSREAKRCHACGKPKPACEFYVDTGAIDGLRNACGSCVLVAEKKRYEISKGVRKAGLSKAVT